MKQINTLTMASQKSSLRVHIWNYFKEREQQRGEEFPTIVGRLKSLGHCFGILQSAEAIDIIWCRPGWCDTDLPGKRLRISAECVEGVVLWVTGGSVFVIFCFCLQIPWAAS